MNNAKKYLGDLVQFASITPNDAGAIDYIKDLLKDSGFDIVLKTFGNDQYQVKNLYAKYGSGRPNICFAGHVDVVHPGDIKLWQSDPFILREADGRIYGRGTSDMKGAIAASLAAVLNFIRAKPKFGGAISFLITSDEEGEAQYGTMKMLEYLQESDEKIDLVVLGEPSSKDCTGDQIKIGRRGSINFILEIIGQQGHVAYPYEAINPIPTLIKIMNELADLTLDSGTEFFEPSNLEIISIDIGNHTTNIIPGLATAKFNIRFNESHTGSSLVQLITQIIEKYTFSYKLIDRLSAEVFIQNAEGIINDFLEIVRDSTNLDTKFATDGGTSDARFIYKFYPVVELGARYCTAHKIDEHIENNDLQTLYKVYYDSLCKFHAK